MDGGLNCETLTKGLVGVWALDGLACVWKSRLQVSLLLSYGIGWPWEGHPGSARPRDMKTSETRG